MDRLPALFIYLLTEATTDIIVFCPRWIKFIYFMSVGLWFGGWVKLFFMCKNSDPLSWSWFVLMLWWWLVEMLLALVCIVWAQFAKGKFVNRK